MFTQFLVCLLLGMCGLGDAHHQPDLNLGLQGRPCQSSLADFHGHAMNAVDGNENPDCTKGSCSITAQQLEPWWRLDLLDTYHISTVSVMARSDCCSESLIGAEILIGDSLENDGKTNPRCAVIDAIEAGTTRSFTCNGMLGRYVTIVIPGREDTLALAEVTVLAGHFQF
uniref:Fucolectin-4 n=1 Tax=Callorhinchus milii TaxID=7868 RepID=K4GL41_CALMI|nr:Fucolectin-4 precursor [Callorhinchus milii]